MNVDSAPFPVMDVDDACCVDCNQPIPVGAPYSLRLTDIAADTISDVVCATGYCRGPQ